MANENDPRPVLRNELARVFKNQRVIRAFEKIFDLIPPEFINQQTQIDSLNLIAEFAGSEANEAIAAINRLTGAVERLALAPPITPTFPPDDVDPPLEFFEDAEVGVWTPTDGSGAGLAFGTAVGSWSRHGDVVIARARVSYPATASGATAQIDGLPYTVFNSQDARQGFMTYTDRGALTYVVPANNTKSINFYDAAGAALTNAAMANRDNYFTAIYKALG